MSVNPHNYQFLRDPLILGRVLWPNVKFYSRQREIIHSVWHNKETVCIAGNMLGKDFVAGFIVLAFFLTRSPCRIVTTSVDGMQLEGVLWGEIRRFLQTSRIPLEHHRGGPLISNHLHLRKVFTSGPQKGEVDGISYCIGRVAAKGEGMLGHHVAETGDGIPRTLFVGDEASGLDDLSISRSETWAERSLLIGNPYPCSNQFKRASEEGDLKSGRRVKNWVGVTLGDTTETTEHYLRKVITVPCSESPNVRYGEAEVAAGREPTNRMLIPGVMSYWKYKERRQSWDPVKQCIQLDARFYEGSELLLYPPDWLDKSAALEERLHGIKRVARAIGCDPGEGEAETAWYVVDEYGILDKLCIRTPDTSDIPDRTVDLMMKWKVSPEKTMFDHGGGGKQHADLMRRMGYNVQTVSFGESVSPRPKRGMTSLQHQIENREERYAYVNRRAEMYARLSALLDPSLGEDGLPRFCIPAHHKELRRQLAPVPKLYDGEGRMYLPSKNKKDPTSKQKTLTEIIGCSPDRADALVVALYCRDFAHKRVTAGRA